jgi:hypothetical protein
MPARTVSARRTVSQAYSSSSLPSRSRRGSFDISAVTSSTVAAETSGLPVRTPEARSDRGRRGFGRVEGALGGGNVGASDFSRSSFGAGPLSRVSAALARRESGRVSGSGGKRGLRDMNPCLRKVRMPDSLPQSNARREPRWRDPAVTLLYCHPCAYSSRLVLSCPRAARLAPLAPCTRRRSVGSSASKAGAPMSSGSIGALESVCQ